MNAKYCSPSEFEKHLFADGTRTVEHTPRDQLSIRVESTLGRSDGHRATSKVGLKGVRYSMNGMAFWHLWLFDDVAGLFVGGNFANTPCVAFVVRERLGDESSNQLEHLDLLVLPCTNRDYVCVVVRAGQLGGV